MSRSWCVDVVSTPSGAARVHHRGPGGSPLLVLGHGAGGGPGALTAVDLVASADAAACAGWSCALVQQPWHVAGRRVAEASTRLDAAWLAVLEALTGGSACAAGSASAGGAALVVGGRSAGARVACRTAAACGAGAVLALAFPLVPPSRPDRSRAAELALPKVAVQVVQGARDAFGVPAPGPGRGVHVVAGADHRFAVRRRDARATEQVATEVREVVRGFLSGVGTGGPSAA